MTVINEGIETPPFIIDKTRYCQYNPTLQYIY